MSTELQRYAICPKQDGKRWHVLEAMIPCKMGEGRTIALDVSHEEMTRLIAQPPQARDLPAVNAGGMARELAALKPESTTDING